MILLLLCGVPGILFLGYWVFNKIAWNRYMHWKDLKNDLPSRKSITCEEDLAYCDRIDRKVDRWDRLSGVDDDRTGFLVGGVVLLIIFACLLVAVLCVNNPTIAKCEKEKLEAERATLVAVINSNDYYLDIDIVRRINHFNDGCINRRSYNHSWWIGAFVSDAEAEVEPILLSEN